MRVEAPRLAFDFRCTDIYGKPFQLSKLRGRRVVLSFFRDAACPFCNYRIYELTRNYYKWKASGVETIVVFSDTSDQVRKYVANRPRPFKMICDPNLKLYDRYGVEKSASALVRALITGLPEIVRGFLTGARPSNNPHMTIVPADFLIDVDGTVIDTWYGRNTADHIPMERLMEFANIRDTSQIKLLAS